MTARIVPIGDDWMLSGAQQRLPASERAAMLQVAARMAADTRMGQLPGNVT